MILLMMMNMITTATTKHDVGLAENGLFYFGSNILAKHMPLCNATVSACGNETLSAFRLSCFRIIPTFCSPFIITKYTTLHDLPLLLSLSCLTYKTTIFFFYSLKSYVSSFVWHRLMLYISSKLLPLLQRSLLLKTL